LEKLISDIKKAAEDLEQPAIFESIKDFSPLTKACKKFLENMGYKTVRFYSTYTKVKTLEGLIELFDGRMQRHHPNLIPHYRNYNNDEDNKDRFIAKKFVESRMIAGDLSEEQALLECAEIILTVFEYESDFSFRIPLTFGVFGQTNLGWVTDKAIQIINKEKAKKDDIRAKEAQEACIKATIKEYGDSGRFDLDKIIKNMEEHNGKEKEKGKSST